MARLLRNWIDGFMQYTEGKGSPEPWRRWAAIATVGAAMERKVWINTVKGSLYPNQYVVLVGTAGAGKSLATNNVYDFLSKLRENKTFHLAPVNVSKASLIDALQNAERRYTRMFPSLVNVTFNSLAIVPNEMGVFLPQYDGEFMNALTDLWDCKHYTETKRTHKISIEMPRTQLNLFTATTPAYLTSLLPEGAWEQGFMARVILIYSSASEYSDLFNAPESDAALETKLHTDLKIINELYGEVKILDEVKEAINAWGRSGGAPVPTHPKLTSYNSRRIAHLLKLCTISCVSESDNMIVNMDHYTEALDWMVEAEAEMPEIFKAMRTGGDQRVIQECYHFVYESYLRGGKKIPVQEHRVIHFLQERTTVQNVQRMLDVMQSAQIIKKEMVKGAGWGYIPLGLLPT